jgi:hypothetical protein
MGTTEYFYKIQKNSNSEFHFVALMNLRFDYILVIVRTDY